MKEQRGMNRREFLRCAAGLSTVVTCPSLLASCAPPCDTTVLAGYQPHVSSAWIPKGEHLNSYQVFKSVVEAATDFSWLSSGDRIFLKLALNSGNPFPATTDPWSLFCMITLLKEKGAGEIFVGDQSGAEHVYHDPEQQRGSSRNLCQSAQLLDVIDETEATAWFFEEFGLDAYREASPSKSHHWTTPILITTVIDNVDHIIHLPRISRHFMAGTTLGMKIAVGYLRSDNRLQGLHGPLNFRAKYEEINHVQDISSKLRLTVSSGRKLLTTFGPDRGEIVEPDYGLILASDDLLAHDLLGTAWLEANGSRIPGDIYCHAALQNYMQGIGGSPETLIWEEINAHPDPAVPDYMKSLLKNVSY